MTWLLLCTLRARFTSVEDAKVRNISGHCVARIGRYSSCTAADGPKFVYGASSQERLYAGDMKAGCSTRARSFCFGSFTCLVHVCTIGKFLGTVRLPPHYDLRFLMRYHTGTAYAVRDVHRHGTKVKGVKTPWQVKVDLAAPRDSCDDDQLLDAYHT